MSDAGAREASDHGELGHVRIIGLPLDLQARGQEHTAELMREFSYVSDPNADASDVPDRLISIINELQSRYADFTETANAARDAARARGDVAVDLDFEIPIDVRQAAQDLGALLDEADEYCRRGDLLTLAAPPDLVDLRHWYLDEFVAQLDGAEPTSWEQWQQARSPG